MVTILLSGFLMLTMFDGIIRVKPDTFLLSQAGRVQLKADVPNSVLAPSSDARSP